MEQKSNTYGYDAQGEKYVDFIEAGIVDPTKVVRVALQNAASVAGLLITTEAMITDRPKKDDGPRCRWWRRHGRHGRHGLLTGRAAPSRRPVIPEGAYAPIRDPVQYEKAKGPEQSGGNHESRKTLHF